METADGDVKLAEKGVVFIDEIDKIACKGGYGVRDVSSGGVQSGLLKLLEGRVVSFPVLGSRKHGKSVRKNAAMDTSKILFICGFPGTDRYLRRCGASHWFSCRRILG